MVIEKLNWDSNFFNKKVGKVNITDQSDIDLQDYIDYDLIYFFVKPNDRWSISKLLNIGAFLVDEKVTFTKDITSQFINIPGKSISTYFRTNQIEDIRVEDIAIQSGEYSRFKIDKNFGHLSFEKLYKTWINKSIDREIANEVFISRNNDEIDGVITIGEKNNRADIGILAVDSKSRGKRIGSMLVQIAESYCYNKHYTILQVVTQKSNTEACNFYEKCGFKLENTIEIYHWWKNK